MEEKASFDQLHPEIVIAAVETFFDLQLDGTVEPYGSYVNRVYGVRSEEGEELIVKFYRPGRWSAEAIEQEHRFLEQLAEADVPVVAPLRDGDGETLFEVEAVLDEDADADGADAQDEADAPVFMFALFPRRGGRGFDAEGDEDWLRLGSLVGRVHQVGRLEDAHHRYRLDPRGWIGGFVTELLEEGVVHPEIAGEFQEVALAGIERIAPLFEGVELHRIHGDCHRGNILDRSREGLLLIDFDDMMVGPAVQDLWLLLPDHAEECPRELALLQEGYGQFSRFDPGEVNLIEPLRFMRIIHFLAWRSRQRHDNWFQRAFPEWGNRAFWIRELEDLREQSRQL